jgi:hypothetical protein
MSYSFKAEARLRAIGPLQRSNVPDSDNQTSAVTDEQITSATASANARRCDRVATNGRPHQPQTRVPTAFRPPQPGQTCTRTCCAPGSEACAPTYWHRNNGRDLSRSTRCRTSVANVTLVERQLLARQRLCARRHASTSSSASERLGRSGCRWSCCSRTSETVRAAKMLVDSRGAGASGAPT